MRKAISNDEGTGTSWSQPDPPTMTFLDLLDVDRAELDELRSRTVVILVPAYPQSMRQAFNRQKKQIARMAQEDLERSLAETIEYAKLLQTALDANIGCKAIQAGPCGQGNREDQPPH